MKQPEVAEYNDLINSRVVYSIAIPHSWLLETRNARRWKWKLCWWLFTLVFHADRGIAGKIARWRRIVAEAGHDA